MAEPADTPVALGGENMADVPSDTPGAFAFEARRARMDWRAIHAVDVDPVSSSLKVDSSVKYPCSFGRVPVVPEGGAHGGTGGHAGRPRGRKYG